MKDEQKKLLQEAYEYCEENDKSTEFMLEHMKSHASVELDDVLDFLHNECGFGEKIDHEYTIEIVCPYCGHEHEDSWEFSDHEEHQDCHSCGKFFSYKRDVDVTYCSLKND